MDLERAIREQVAAEQALAAWDCPECDGTGFGSYDDSECVPCGGTGFRNGVIPPDDDTP